MPNKLDNDSELAALLHKAEPPQSPAHLDEAILAYAREHVPVPEAKHSLFGDMRWMQRNWVSAVATFSIAAIAISVSLQFFTDPELPRAPTATRTEALAVETATARELADATAKLEQRMELAEPTLAAPAAVPLQDTQAGLELDAGAAAIAPASATAFIAEELTAATADTAVAAAPAIALTAGRSASNQLAAISPELQNLVGTVTADAALQSTVISVMRRALGSREQNSVMRRGNFPDEIRPYIETYRGLRDATILANVQNRYRSARSDLLETRLPETVEELVSMLETL
ncbi:MAG: hypothetical protein EXR84_07945 [Gammaproteobacteria bacterium]|nr:hypothetical protein [Gammaproteobacteria bacterium]